MPYHCNNFIYKFRRALQLCSINYTILQINIYIYQRHLWNCPDINISRTNNLGIINRIKIRVISTRIYYYKGQTPYNVIYIYEI